MSKMFTATFDAEDFKSRLRQLRAFITQLPYEAIKAMSEDGSRLAGIWMNKDTWSLFRSRRVLEPQQIDGRWFGGFVEGGEVVNPKTGRLVDYAWYHEMYNPHMRPAVSYVMNNLEMYWQKYGGGV